MLSSIHHGVGGHSDEIRIVMSQLHGMASNATGIADPRVDGWFASVAEYEGSYEPSVAATAPESWDGSDYPTAPHKPRWTRT